MTQSELCSKKVDSTPNANKLSVFLVLVVVGNGDTVLHRILLLQFESHTHDSVERMVDNVVVGGRNRESMEVVRIALFASFCSNERV